MLSVAAWVGERIASPSVIAAVFAAFVGFQTWVVRTIHRNSKALTRIDTRLGVLCEHYLGRDPAAERDVSHGRESGRYEAEEVNP